MVSLCTSDEWRIAELAATAHQAAHDLNAAQRFHERACHLFGADLSLLATHDATDGRCEIVFPGNAVSAPLNTYVNTFARTNVWIRPLRDWVQAGVVWRGEEVVNDLELRDSRFYREWLQPNGLRHWMAGTIAVEGTRSSYMALLRADGALPFGRREALRLRRLLPHLRYATGQSNGVSDVDMFGGPALFVLEQTMYGVLGFDRAGKVRYTSARAAAILNQHDGLSLRDGSLVAENEADSARLAEIVAAALAGGLSPRASRAIAIRRRSEQLPYFVRLFPGVLPTTPDRAPSGGAIAIVQDPSDRIELDRDLLMSLYDLTPAETRLAQLLSQGLSPATAAVDLGITINTVRTHLKRIFEKTGISRQSELVRLLLACFAMNSSGSGKPPDRNGAPARPPELRLVR